jgi:hypothetical protein
LLRLECSIPATNVATDDLWLAVGEIAVLGQPVDRYGQPYANPRTTHWLASEIVEDLLGRLLTFCEGVTADIDTTTAEIDQLAYLDAATPAQVFDDLSLHEPDFYWGIGSTGTNGKHRFWYRAWPTTPRYEISTKDGYSAPGGEADLCNRIAINWTDTKGSTQTTIVTSTVPALGTRVRDAEPVTLPVGLGSLAGAQRVGELVLASKASPPKAATAVVRRPVVDHLRGCMVNLWEIEPGYLVRVRETGDDLRLTEMEYADADVAATLTLGTPVRSTDQLIADVSRKVSA